MKNTLYIGLLALVFGNAANADTNKNGDFLYKTLESKVCSGINNGSVKIKFHGNNPIFSKREYSVVLSVDKEFQIIQAGYLNVSSNFNSSYSVRFGNDDFHIYHPESGPKCEEDPQACHQDINEFMGQLIQAKTKPIGSLTSDQADAIECALELANGWRDRLEALHAM